MSTKRRSDVRTGRGRSTPAADSELRDARDGLTRLERIILVQLRAAEQERRGASVPTALLYGRVVEHIDVSIEEFQAVLSRLIGARY